MFTLKGVSNGELIEAAEKAGFDIKVTADRNLRYEQTISGRRLMLVVLPGNNWNTIKRNLDEIAPVLTRVKQGTYEEVEFRRIKG